MNGDTYNMKQQSLTQWIQNTDQTETIGDNTMKQQSLIEWIENEEVAAKVERKLSRIDRYLLAALGCKRIAPAKR